MTALLDRDRFLGAFTKGSGADMRRWTATAVAFATLVLESAATPGEAMDFKQKNRARGCGGSP